MMQRYVEASERNDWEAATAFWADDIVVYALDRDPQAGDFLGKRACPEHAGRIFTNSERIMGLV